MTEIEIKNLEAEIIDKISSFPKSARLSFINKLSEKFSKDYDDPVLSDKVIDLGKQIKSIDNKINCVPVGIYSWSESVIDFNVNQFTVMNDSEKLIKDYHENGLYKNYTCPKFTDDMTKGDWKNIVSLWTDLIKESGLEACDSNNCDYNESFTCWMMVYDIDNEKFVTLEENY